MSDAKIRLSAPEEELVANASFILTKNAILGKIKTWLGNFQQAQQAWLETVSLPASLLPLSSPKISRGENYNGLPYLVLDFPRQFDPEDIFTMRTMFWWGNFFSVTLQLSGQFKNEFGQVIAQHYHLLKKGQFYCCINEAQWEHHFDQNNYLLIADMPEEYFKQQCRERSFIKIAGKISFDNWDEIPGRLEILYRQLIGMLVVPT